MARRRDEGHGTPNPGGAAPGVADVDAALAAMGAAELRGRVKTNCAAGRARRPAVGHPEAKDYPG